MRLGPVTQYVHLGPWVSQWHGTAAEYVISAAVARFARVTSMRAAEAATSASATAGGVGCCVICIRSSWCPMACGCDERPNALHSGEGSHKETPGLSPGSCGWRRAQQHAPHGLSLQTSHNPIVDYLFYLVKVGKAVPRQRRMGRAVGRA